MTYQKNDSGGPRSARTAVNVRNDNNFIKRDPHTQHEHSIWSYAQHWVYHKPVKDVDQLKQHQTGFWSGMQQTIVDEATDKWKRCLWACGHVKG